jgi:hypothetical protein
MGKGVGVQRTMEAWQALAGEITKLVINPRTEALDPAKASELLTVFYSVTMRF